MRFNSTPGDARLIELIAKRYCVIIGTDICDQTQTEMTITATHLNGCPLDLQKLLKASDSTLCHDIGGMERCVCTETGRLLNHFLPRCALPETVSV